MRKLTGQSLIMCVFRQALIFVFASGLLFCWLGVGRAAAQQSQAAAVGARDARALKWCQVPFSGK